MILSPGELEAVALLHAAATLIMVGAIWIVQRVHYPLFAFADRARWCEFHAAHSARITPVVGPTMVIELGSAAALAWAWPGGAPNVAWLGLALAAVTWLATFALAVPLHERLGGGPDEAAARRLVTTNWVRTLAWTARGAIALALVHLAR